MSRNTEYLIPSVALPYLGAVKPSDLDDRYLCYILYNWIEAGVATEPQTHQPKLDEQYFKNSSLLRISNSKYFLVSNVLKGGSFRIYMNNKVYYDSGIEIDLNGRPYSTGILDTNNSVLFENGLLHVTGYAKEIREPLLTTGIAVVFRLWQLIFGPFRSLQALTKKLLRSRMISYADRNPIKFERTIEYGPDSVSVTDIVHKQLSAENILIGVKSAYTAVPSSKYAALPETAGRLLVPTIEQGTHNGLYRIKRTFLLNRDIR